MILTVTLNFLIKINTHQQILLNNFELFATDAISQQIFVTLYFTTLFSIALQTSIDATGFRDISILICGQPLPYPSVSLFRYLNNKIHSTALIALTSLFVPILS